MYKLPEAVLTSTVYKGWKIVVGWKRIRAFLEKMHSVGYTIVRTHHSYSTVDYNFIIVASFSEGGETKRLRIKWEPNGSLNLLKYRMTLADVVIETPANESIMTTIFGEK